MCRSSIFSFDTLQRPTSTPKGLLLALALLLSVELGIARRDWFWHQIPRSSGGVVDALENQVIASAREPKVVLLGNSRLRDAISPRLLENEMGLRKGTALNLALTGGTPFDSLTMYSRNRAKLSRADFLIVDYELYYVTHRPSLPNVRIQRFATLEERLRMFRGTNDLGPSLIGYCWRTYGVARALDGWRRNWFMRQTEPVIGEDSRVEWRTSEKLNDDRTAQGNGSAAIAIVNPLDLSLSDCSYYRTEYRDYFLHLVDLAREDEVRVVLVYAPLRNAVVDFARREYPASYEFARNQVVALGNKADAFLCFESARDLGISDADFVDHRHMASSGGDIMTQRLGRFLTSKFGGFNE